MHEHRSILFEDDDAFSRLQLGTCSSPVFNPAVANNDHSLAFSQRFSDYLRSLFYRWVLCCC
jgi:hypothetical protein